MNIGDAWQVLRKLKRSSTHVAPDALRGHLPQVLVLVLEGRVDARHGGDALDHLQTARARGRPREGPRDAAVDAEDVAIDDGRERQAVEDLV